MFDKTKPISSIENHLNYIKNIFLDKRDDELSEDAKRKRDSYGVVIDDLILCGVLKKDQKGNFALESEASAVDFLKRNGFRVLFDEERNKFSISSEKGEVLFEEKYENDLDDEEFEKIPEKLASLFLIQSLSK
jgi:hypothetical protein